MFGALVIDKPAGWTSHDVVARMRRLAGMKKIGHLGTLDPMATGVLPLLLGHATRLARFFEATQKVYEGEVRFGFSTNTYDAEGEPTSEVRAFVADIAEIEPILHQRFLGEIQQTPPAVSAKKIQGTPAYKLARANKEVALEPVTVHIHECQVLACQEDRLRLRVVCSAGTYMRSIAHDLGEIFGVGAHLATLRRVSSGPFRIADAVSMAEAEDLAAKGELESRVIAAASLLPEMPVEVVDDLTARQIRDGRDFRCSPFSSSPAQLRMKAVSRSGQLVAIGQRKLHNLYHPEIVFPAD